MTEKKDCPTDGCNGTTELVVPVASEYCCNDCRMAYVWLASGEWAGGVET